MGTLNLLLIGIGVAMDAVAITIAKSICIRHFSFRDSVRLAGWFAVFQAGMPFFGWALGIHFDAYIVSFDHWVAFILLGLVGSKMLFEGAEEKEEDCDSNLSLKTILILAVATSIDALAVGVSFAFLSVNIGRAISIIGLVTFVLCVLAGRLGSKLGSYMEKRANMVGGLLLIAMGAKILLEHTILL